MIVTLDFETHAIESDAPWPDAVGCAIQIGGRPGKYLSWGHPTGNNTTEHDAASALDQLVNDAGTVVMFNAPFDVGVARRLGVDVPWRKVEDAQVLAFLADPYAQRRGLKDLAHVELGLAPDERDDLDAWIKAFVPEAKGKRKLGAYISRAPGDLVGRYARGDVRRTYKLWKHWERHRGRAFRREMALLPVLEDMTLRGVPLDGDALAAELPDHQISFRHAERKLRAMLRNRDLDLDRHEAVADALEKADLVAEWVETAKGRRSLAYEALAMLVAEGKFDARFAVLWGYRSVLIHTLRTFAEPWAEAGGVLHPQWNSVKKERSAGGAGAFGAVTGRLSSSPNVQNIIKHPPAFAGMPPLPAMRRYVRAPAGHRLVGVDVSQQELRILAHAVGSPLADWYRDDPRLDLHDRVAAEVRRLTGLDIGRTRAKVVNLATIYKNGIASMAAKIGCTYDEARRVKHAHARAVPGIARWERQLAAGQTFDTVGGRTYHHDPMRPYKSGNTYIQGSAADQLKEILIEAPGPLAHLGARLVLTAHDEIVALAPAANAAAVGLKLVELVADTGLGGAGQMFSVPMVSESYERERWME